MLPAFLCVWNWWRWRFFFLHTSRFMYIVQGRIRWLSSLSKYGKKDLDRIQFRNNAIILTIFSFFPFQQFQGWDFAHSHKIAQIFEWLRLIRFRCSLKKSDHERIALVAPKKRASMSDSLRLLMTREQREQFALFHEWIVLSLFRSQKSSNSLEKPMSEFPTL